MALKFCDEREAARVLACSRALLRRMRSERRGPRWTRIGRLVRYRDDWLVEFADANATPPVGAREQLAAHENPNKRRARLP